MGFVYLIENKINGKKYIGQTIKSIEKRFNQHQKAATKPKRGCTALYNAINYYGFENFTIKMLTEIENDKLDEMETKYITEYNTLCPNGYNIQTGGSGKGKIHCEESRERMREKKLGSKNPNYGKSRDKDTRKKISDAKKGENHHFFNKELSHEHKLKLSRAHRKDDLPMYMVHINARPKYYQDEGYVIINHPKSKPKYFTSKKFSLEEKYNQAINYLKSLEFL